MNIQTDSKGQSYIEVPMYDEQVRITYINPSWDGGPTIRMQIRDVGGHLRQGPDMPLDVAGDVIKAMWELLRDMNPKKPSGV